MSGTLQVPARAPAPAPAPWQARVLFAALLAAFLASAAVSARADGPAAPVAGASSPPQAVEAPPRREQRAAQQAALKTLLAEREADCAHHFAVIDCISSARSEQREVLARLSDADLADDAAQRGDDAERRRQSLAEKAAASALRVAAADAVEASATARTTTLTTTTARTTTRAPPDALAHGAAVPPGRSGLATGADRAALEAQHLASFNARQRRATAHRQSVNQRNVARVAEGAQMAPLPDLTAR